MTPTAGPTSTLYVIMPAYNEEGAIRDAVAEVQGAILDVVPGASLLVVNDGSRDRTGPILDEIAAGDARVRVFHKPNGGHGPAIISGLEQGTSDWVFLLDSDRQIPLDRFHEAWAKAQAGHDGVFGVRRHRNDPGIRLVLTAVIRWTIRGLFGVWLYDSNVPYKLLRRSVWQQARTHIPADTLAPSLMIAIYMKRKGLNIAEVPITHRERSTGEVSIKRWKLVKFCARAFRQLMQFRSGLEAA